MRHRSMSSSDGASAVEFAILLPLLLMILFGILTGGLALTQQQQINHAAREGARYGATLDEFPATTAYDRVATRTANTAPALYKADTAVICVMFDTGSAESQRWYSVGGSGPVFTGTSAPSANYDCTDILASSSEAHLQVRMWVDADLQALLVNKQMVLKAEAVAVYEQD